MGKWFLIFFVFSSFVFADSNPVNIKKSALENFKKGYYEKALKDLNKLKNYSGQKKLAYYWRGIIYNKTNKYSKAIKDLKRANAMGAKFNDLYYELGQAYYADNSLEKARSNFLASNNLGHKSSQSLYYAGYSSKLLEDFPQALSSFEEIIKNYREDSNLLQATHLQKAEINYELFISKKQKPDLLASNVLPQYKVAYKVDDESLLATTINKRMNEIRKKHGLFAGKRYFLRFTQSNIYDSNVILRADESTEIPTNEDSLIYTSSIFGKYKFPVKKGVMVTPEVKLSNTYHGEREQAAVFQNDAYSINPALRTSVDHMMFGKRFTLSGDLEYSYNGKDVNSNKNRVFNTESITYNIGENFKYFKIGDSTVKFKFKDAKNRDSSLDSKTFSINLFQNFNLPGKKVILLAANMDFLNSETENNSTNTYLLRADYISKHRILGLNYKPALALTVTDTKLQQSTRGYETTINPTLKIFRKIMKKFEFSLQYGYTKNISKAKATNDYQKQTVTFDLEVSL
jgi:tetratricopeptide (TPR) repeat protein